MADDFSQLMARLASMTPQVDPGKPIPILGGKHGEINVGNPLSIRGAVFNIDNMMVKSQKRPGGLAKILSDMGFNQKDFIEGLQKVAQAGPVQQASQADLFGQGMPSGGSFVSSVDNSRGNSNDGGMSV